MSSVYWLCAPLTPSMARNIPELNWSIAKEEQGSNTISSKKNIKGSQSTSRLPDPGSSSPLTTHTNNSTSCLPFLPLKEGGSSGSSAAATDSDGSSGEDRGRRKKSFEVNNFVKIFSKIFS